MNTTPGSTLLPAEEILLDSRLDDVRRDLAAHSAPAALEDALVASFRRQRRASSRPRMCGFRRWRSPRRLRW